MIKQPSYKLLIRDNNRLKNLLYPVFLRITKDRQSIFIKTGVNVSKSEWNDKLQRVSTKNEFSNSINQRLQRFKIQAEQEVFDIISKEDCSVQELKIKLLNKSEETIGEYCLKLWSTIKPTYTTDKNNRQMLRDLEDANLANIKIRHFSKAKLEQFDKYLIEVRKNQNNTRNKKFERLNQVLKSAKEKSIIEHNPFDTFPIPSRTETIKQKLSREEIQKLENVDLSKESQIFAKDVFLFSFYADGMRFGDTITLRRNNIIDTSNDNLGFDWGILYTMNKTNQETPVYLNEKALAILERYNWKDKEENDYIFPISNKSLDFEQERKQIETFNAYLNKQLKDIAKLCGITKNLTFHIARHTWASLAVDMGATAIEIQDHLGHKDYKTSQTYTKGRDSRRKKAELSKKMAQ